MNSRFFFWLTLILLSMSSLPLFSEFAGGSGTEEDPWQVATAEHLNNVRNYLGYIHKNKHFIQTADIDLGVAPWNQGEGWVPIGTYYAYHIYSFIGNYDGDGYIISGLYINRPEAWCQGLFGFSEGTIQNLGLTNLNVTGGVWGTGGLVGGNYGNFNFWDDGANVADGRVDDGLVEWDTEGYIYNCYCTGNVTGEDYTGGLAGLNYGGNINNCYCTGNVSGGVLTGGLLGWNAEGNINNCYCTGNVMGGNATGGFVGSNDAGNINNCYSSGNVTGGDHTGGLVGLDASGNISNSYWDINKSGQITSAGGEGRYTSEMVFPHSTNTYQDWDWQIWKQDPTHTINDGYPFLRYPDFTPTDSPSPAVCVSPNDQALLVLPDISLKWNLEFNPNFYALPSGFILWLGTDDPPSNICDSLDLGYILEYNPDPVLQFNTTFYWKIVPYNDIGEAQDCPIWSFTTCDNNSVLTYPNGGEVWLSGTTRSIQWLENIYPSVELSISLDGGNQWLPISSVEDEKNYYHYQVPTVNSNACRIKLVSLPNGDLYDISDGNFSISTSSSRPKVVLTYPSDENVHLGVDKNVNLTWTRQNVVAVSLDYSFDDGQTWTEIANGLDSDSYSWLVPDTPSIQCRVRVRSDLDSEVLDISDNMFNICKVQITSPIGGETFTSDYSETYSIPIFWSASAIDNVKIESSSDGGTSWSNIVNSTNSSSEEYYWRLPGVPSSNYLIRISNVTDTSINSVSETFALRNPIKLVNCNGGGFITNNSMFNIRWNMQDIDPTAKLFLEYALDNLSWNRINNSAVPVSNESMYWFVNIGLEDNVWVRAVNQDTGKIVGKSEASFRITNNALILYEPNGGEEYIEFSNQTISWDCDGLTNLNILFSSDDGETWSQIAENVPASSGSHAWTIPATPSHNCRIRLQDQTHAYMRLDSDLPFSILPLQVVDPTVDFTADVLSGDIPLGVQFSSEIDPGVGSIASLLWDFGDGNTSTDANPLHVYEVPGTYTVSLSVTNDFGGTATESKEDYITALPQTPRIELLSPASLNFGVVYLGDVSPVQSIEVKNVGTAALHIDSASFHLPNSQFALTDTELPITVPVNGSALLKVVFIPVVSGAVGDSIFIHSDASNIPELAVRLNAIGEFVPPAAVEEVGIWVVDDDIHLSWQPVTKTIYDTPIQPDGYVIINNELPYEDQNQYSFHSFVTGTEFVHAHVGEFRRHMFYRIVTVKFYRDEEIAWLRGLNTQRDRRMTWGEVKEELNKLKSRP